jgi:hypothetical protein
MFFSTNMQVGSQCWYVAPRFTLGQFMNFPDFHASGKPASCDTLDASER